MRQQAKLFRSHSAMCHYGQTAVLLSLFCAVNSSSAGANATEKDCSDVDTFILRNPKNTKSSDSSACTVKANLNLGSHETFIIEDNQERAEYTLGNQEIEFRAGRILLAVGNRSISIHTEFGNVLIPSKTTAIVRCVPQIGMDLSNLSGHNIDFHYRHEGLGNNFQIDPGQDLIIAADNSFNSKSTPEEPPAPPNPYFRAPTNGHLSPPGISQEWSPAHADLLDKFAVMTKNKVSTNDSLLKRISEIRRRMPPITVDVTMALTLPRAKTLLTIFDIARATQRGRVTPWTRRLL